MKFTVTVQQTEIYEYKPVEIDAEDEDVAQEIAEEMRVNGELGEPELIECSDVDIKTVANTGRLVGAVA